MENIQRSSIFTIFIVLLLFLSLVRFNFHNTERTKKEFFYDGELQYIKNYKLGQLEGVQLEFERDSLGIKEITYYHNGKESSTGYKEWPRGKMSIPVSEEFTLDPYFKSARRTVDDVDEWSIPIGRYTFQNHYGKKKLKERIWGVSGNENKVKFENYEPYEEGSTWKGTAFYVKVLRTGYYKMKDDESTYTEYDGDFVNSLYYDRKTDSLFKYDSLDSCWNHELGSYYTTPYFKRTYKDGKLHGLYECLNDKGDLLCSGYMLEGKKRWKMDRMGQL